MNTEIPIGSVAVAKLTTEACFAGELGVCYGVSDCEGQTVYGFIFETGRFKVFTAQRAAQALGLVGRVSDAVAGYRYRNDAQLQADFRAGGFKEAFPSLQSKS